MSSQIGIVFPYYFCKCIFLFQLHSLPCHILGSSEQPDGKKKLFWSTIKTFPEPAADEWLSRIGPWQHSRRVHDCERDSLGCKVDSSFSSRFEGHSVRRQVVHTEPSIFPSVKSMLTYVRIGCVSRVHDVVDRVETATPVQPKHDPGCDLKGMKRLSDIKQKAWHANDLTLPTPAQRE